MPRKDMVKYLNPWIRKREKTQLRFQALRSRDGDNCRRCRRPLRFDLPPGHDKAPTIEQLTPKPSNGGGGLDHLCLCHRRCNPEIIDHTAEVQERLRLRA